MSKKKTKELDYSELPTAEGCKVYEKKKYRKLGFRNVWKLKSKPEKSFLIKMLFSNGTSKEFVIVGKTETFDYRKRTYYLQYENSWFNITQNQYELTYFDDFPVPVNRKIIKEGDEAFFSVTPENLKPLIKMEYVKALASSEEITKKLKTIIFFCFVFLFMFIINILVSWSARSLVKKAMGLE